MSYISVNDNKRLSPEMQRLMDALAGLTAALDDQAQAVANFRSSCDRLESSISSCGDNLTRYQASLDNIDVKSIQKKSEVLAQQADRWAQSSR